MIDPNFYILTSRQLFIPTGGSFDASENYIAGFLDLDREDGTSADPVNNLGLEDPEFDCAFSEVSAFAMSDILGGFQNYVHSRSDFNQTNQFAARLFSRRSGSKSNTDYVDNSRMLILKSV